jgi:hypothetical protein
MSKNPWGGIAGEEIIAKLEAKDIASETVVLTIKRAFIETIYEKGTGEVLDTKLVVEFDEFPKKGLKCNKTQGNAFRALVAAGKLPNDFNEVDESWGWEGLSVPLYKKDVEYKGETFPKLYPVSPSAFDSALVGMKKAGAAPKKGSRSSK